MKNVVLSALLAVCFSAVPVFPANAQDYDYGGIAKSRFYIGYEVGARFLKSEEEPGIKIDVDTGASNSLFVGYADGNGWRGELVSSFGRNNYKATAAVAPGATLTIDSSFDIYTGMVRGFYDFSTGGKTTPFLGAGIGWSRVETSARFAGTNVTVVASENYFTYSGIAGFRFAATENFSIGAQYGFVGYGGDDFAHDATVSFSYAF